MTKPAFTPGPWEIGEGPATGRACIISADGTWICGQIMNAAGLADETGANAHLIAAAPDLLEATQNLLGFFDNAVYRRRLAGDSLYEEAIRQARTALAKAEAR